MPTLEDPSTGAEGLDEDRPKRADARRNRELLLEAAHVVFARDGGQASMEAIARQAGVGIGTLYRHFPRRIDLVEAVYLEEVDGLTRTADQVVAELEPWPALVAFLDAFVDYARGKRTILNELQEAFEKNPDLRSNCKGRIEQAMETVVARGQAAGVVRTDVAGSDLFQLLAPMCANSTLLEDQSGRLLAVILDGLRPPA
ncbi:MAG: TetR/AcrR family transcriptional regulator [Acidimicrobiales bacterium]|nr:TetR/AcrR family transcriptional regulator [Acidimicrobiales bacterium]